ncbi:RidA family protein [Colwelliaceae bacterium 6441]
MSSRKASIHVEGTVMQYFTKKILMITCFFISQIVAADERNSHVQFLNSATHIENKLPFSEAVKVGDLLFLSGQIGFDAKTKKLVAGGIKNESIKAMENIKATLENFGYSMKNLVKCTVMLADIKEWAAFNKEYVKFFEQPFPARSAFAASGLALNSRVEVECIASAGADNN